MRSETEARLDCIASSFWDSLCRWPRELHDESELEDKCNSCQTMTDLINLVEALDPTPFTH